MLSTVLRDTFGDNGHDCSAHETDSELQLLRCLFPKLQDLSDPACQRSSDSGPACLQDLARYPWWGSAFGVGGRGRSPIELTPTATGTTVLQIQLSNAVIPLALDATSPRFQPMQPMMKPESSILDVKL